MMRVTCFRRGFALGLFFASLSHAVRIARQDFQIDAQDQVEDARDICHTNRFDPMADSIRFNKLLPPPSAVNKGQRMAQPTHDDIKINTAPMYAHPNERLVVCSDPLSDPPGFLFTKKLANTTFSVKRRGLSKEEVRDLFSTLLKAWPRGPDARTAEEDDNFLFVVDADSNFIVAPIMQGGAGEGGAKLGEVKHGDLMPGLVPFGAGADAGPFRGLGRLGGEIHLAGDRDGKEWVVTQRSSYSLSRVSPDVAQKFHDEYAEKGKTEAQIWSNFQSCVAADKPIDMNEMGKFYCYLRELGLAMQLGWSGQCTMGDVTAVNVSHGNLPVLSACQSAGSLETCAPTKVAAQESPPLVNIVAWAPGADLTKCEKTVQDLDDIFRAIDTAIASFNGTFTEETKHALSWRLKIFNRDACFSNAEFLSKLSCSPLGCFEEGFLPNLKKVQQKLKDNISPAEFEALWKDAKIVRGWNKCVGRT